MVRHFGQLRIPTPIEDKVDFVSGLTELWEPSHIKSVHQAPINRRNDVSAGYLIPQVIRNIYGMPSSFQTSPKSSICVAEFQDDASYSEDDLKYWNSQVGETTQVTKKVGPFDPSSPDGEATLDAQYAFALALNKTSWFWTVRGWMYEFTTAIINTPNPPLVISMSWGWPEPRQCEVGTCTDSKAYVDRVNNEFLKITSLGVTLLAASGDNGAPGSSNPSCDSTSNPLSTIFPGASPWITSVGASMLNPKGASSPFTYNQPACKQFSCATITSETSCSYPSSLITTGGGFSNYVVQPTWQINAVTAHLNNNASKLPPSIYFNKNNRAFPDVSALGHSYLIGISSYFGSAGLEQVDGTSASTPVFAAVVSLFNDHRLLQGKKPLGFINPILYKAPSSVWNDITTGNNYATESCIAKYGFTATTGWDPVTGLGTPKFLPLARYINTLP